MKPFRARYLITVTGNPMHEAIGCGDRAMEERAMERAIIHPTLETVESFWQTGLAMAEVTVKCVDGQEQVAAPTWHQGEPPKDRPVVVVGNLKYMGRDGETLVQPFSRCVQWEEGEWMGVYSGMSLRDTTEDEVIFHWWSELPKEAGQ